MNLHFPGIHTLGVGIVSACSDILGPRVVPSLVSCPQMDIPGAGIQSQSRPWPQALQGSGPAKGGCCSLPCRRDTPHSLCSGSWHKCCPRFIIYPDRQEQKLYREASEAVQLEALISTLVTRWARTTADCLPEPQI